MISGNNYKTVEIFIKIYNSDKTMNEDRFEKRHCKSNQNRFVCSICLNRKSCKSDKNIESKKRDLKSCPMCRQNCDYENRKDNDSDKELDASDEKHGKIIQTSEPDVTRGMSLLNEVLTVFQNKKQTENKKDKLKTVIYKDASVNTDFKKDVSKLNISKAFSFSIDENNHMYNNKFVVINCQPETVKVSQCSMDLMHRKSSSIPQMKLEELKKSLKEKSKSKDAIEEVNRMFATVRKCEINEKVCETPNRPMIRNGPRVLPVVKTNNPDLDAKNKPVVNCRYCQTNYKMSSGDSFECCHKTNDTCEDCFYMMCCHYQHRLNSGAACQNCNQCDHSKSRNNCA